MPIRTALLNWNNISRDTDFSKYIETVSEPWVIEGLEVSATKVGIWKARVPCERTNWETIYALVYNSSEATISWNGEVYILVSQTYIDDWELANEDWTWIATIEVWTTPSKNALKLATITNWTVVDNRNMIPKVWELSTQIDTIFSQLEDLDERVEKLEEAWAIDHLEESGLVGELYSLSDTLFKQNTPALADSSLDCNVSDVAANTQIHIQRIGSWTASNQLKLKVKMVWSSTQNLKVEVRKWVKVEVSSSEAYWYWDEVIASWSIAYSDISSDYAEKTITLDNNFWWTKGQLLDIVVYMDTVNASNYYCVACDSTQYSEWFSYVSVNGSTRTRSKLMPYGISEGFAQSLLSKGQSQIIAIDNDRVLIESEKPSWNITSTYTKTVNYTWVWSFKRTIICRVGVSSSSYTRPSVSVNVDWTQVYYYQLTSSDIYDFWRNCFFDITTSWEHTIQLILNWWNNNAYFYFSSDSHYSELSVERKLFYTSWTGIPTEIKSIWNLWTSNIFWKNTNPNYADFFTGFETNTATTWNITPWNFVWYLDIWWYKIPYYK